MSRTPGSCATSTSERISPESRAIRGLNYAELLNLPLGLPHVALPADDPVLHFLHPPPVAKLGLLERARNQKALRFLAPVTFQELELRSCLHAFRDDAQAERVR